MRPIWRKDCERPDLVGGQSFQTARQTAAHQAITQTLALTAFDGATEEWEQFANNLTETLMKRLAIEDLTDGASTFCFVKHPHKYVRTDKAVAVRDIDLTPEHPITGNLFLLGISGNGGLRIPVANQSAAETIIVELGLAAHAVGTFYAGPRQLRIYPNGLSAEEQHTIALLPSAPPFDLAALRKIVDAVHETNFCTPQHTNPAFWTDAGKWLPCSAAEKNIQWPLKAAFVAALQPHIIVQDEAVNHIGDADFAFYDATAGTASPPLAIMEAKVQKSYRDSGDVQPNETGREYIRGLIQTASYGRATNAGWSALFCFDLRKPATGGDTAWDNARKRTQKVLALLAAPSRGGPPDVVTWMCFGDTGEAQAATAMGPLVSTDPLYPVTKRPDYKALLGA